jgi:stage II sporulation protein AB (anti-sigma F factor)
MKEKLKRAENEIKLSFPSLSVNESLARGAAALFVSQLNPTIEEISDIKCAVSEAVTNCIVHGYRDKVGTIEMKLQVFADRTVRIYIRDKGCGIENIAKAMEPLYTTDPGGERSGMGFAVMESFMDELRVKSVPGHGTKIVMTRKISTAQRVR